MSNEIETNVANYLQTKGIQFSVVGGIATNRDGWECDQWMYSFTRSGKKDAMTGEYFTGTGHRKLTTRGKVAVAPHVAGVLYSLILDSSTAEQNFHDWCSDFGCDPDSIKALSTYNACCETLNKMRGFFTKEERDELQEMLQDY